MTPFLWILIVIAVLVCLYVFLIFPAPRHADESSLAGWNYAHRGLHDKDAGIPENSITAFQRAVESGYGIELDVHLTKDDVAIVHHDPNLKRVCGDDVTIRDVTYEELCRHPLPDGSVVPTFREVLDIVGGRVPLIVEVKHESGAVRTAEGAWQLLKDYQGPYCIESFNPFSVAYFRKNAPKVIRGQLSTNYRKDMSKKDAKPFFLVSHLLTNVLCRPDFIAYDELHDREFSLWLLKHFFHVIPVAWTIRSPEQEVRARKKGYRYIIFEKYLAETKNEKQ